MAQPLVTCMKGLFLIFNFVFWLTGLALLIVGILSKFAFSYLMKLSTEVNYNLAPYIMIGCGVFIVLMGFIGCWAAVKEHPWALKLYMFVLIVLFIVEMAGAISGYVLRNKLKSGLEKGLEDAVSQYFSPNADADLNSAMDKVQESYVKCCGVNNYTDYFTTTKRTRRAVDTAPASNVTAVPPVTTTLAPTTVDPSTTPLVTNATAVPPTNASSTILPVTNSSTTPSTPELKRVPKSCCINKDGSNCKYENLDGVAEKDMGIYTHGCYDEMVDKAKKNFLIVGGVALGIALFQEKGTSQDVDVKNQILGVICAYILIKQFKDSNYEKM